MTVAEFMILFEAQYILDTTKVYIRDQFRELRQGCMSVQAYTWRFTELTLFKPEDMATNTLRVGRIRRGLRDDV